MSPALYGQAVKCIRIRSYPIFLAVWLHVAVWYIHRPQSDDIVTLLRPILQDYMEPLGRFFLGYVGLVQTEELQSICRQVPEDRGCGTSASSQSLRDPKDPVRVPLWK